MTRKEDRHVHASPLYPWLWYAVFGRGACNSDGAAIRASLGNRPGAGGGGGYSVFCDRLVMSARNGHVRHAFIFRVKLKFC